MPGDRPSPRLRTQIESCVSRCREDLLLPQSFFRASRELHLDRSLSDSCGGQRLDCSVPPQTCRKGRFSSAVFPQGSPCKYDEFPEGLVASLRRPFPRCSTQFLHHRSLRGRFLESPRGPLLWNSSPTLSLCP